MQLCQIHFYQKIARKKVARVNAALEVDCIFYFLVDFFFSRINIKYLQIVMLNYNQFEIDA